MTLIICNNSNCMYSKNRNDGLYQCGCTTIGITLKNECDTFMIHPILTHGKMKIKCAAIRYNGQIYDGESHAKIGIKMVQDGVCPEPYPHGEDQGFVTECGRYVRREPALIIAISAGQVEDGKTFQPNKLFSEDLK